MSRARRWTFTLHDYNTEDEERLRALEDVSYVCYGKEVAPSTGRAHLQGYVEFMSVKSLRQVKLLVSSTAHLEKARGTGLENHNYCKKDGEFWEKGTFSKQGRRSDLLEIQTMIENGATDLEIAQTYFSAWTRMRSAISDYRKLIRPRRVSVEHDVNQFPDTWRESELGISTIMWGESGIGKTSYAKALLPNALLVSHMDDLLRFNDQYEGIIFDDMSFTHLPRSAQIHLLDSDNERSIHCRYNVAVIPAQTKKIFTCNDDDGYIFDLTDAAINRRVTVIHLGPRN